MSDNSFTDGYIMTIGDLFNEEQLSIIRETLNDYTIDFNITPVTKVFLANTQMSNYDIVYILEEQNIGR